VKNVIGPGEEPAGIIGQGFALQNSSATKTIPKQMKREHQFNHGQDIEHLSLHVFGRG
jgi:hypothetical protein